TIGNFEPADAGAFLRHAGEVLGPGTLFLVGVDLVKDHGILHRAYNDSAGVTAQFNLNLLARINREHGAFFNAEQSRIEMHLVSTKPQQVHLNGVNIDFRQGETIHTENSYKYTIESFQALARSTGWSPVEAFSDELFAVHALRR